MVQFNAKKQEVTIVVNGDVSNLQEMQTALIDLLRNYRFSELGQSASNTFYFGLNLLESMLPDFEQQRRGLISDADYLEMPENMNQQQREKLKQALYMLGGGKKSSSEKNQVFEALQTLAE